jgi:hypothetical protein
MILDLPNLLVFMQHSFYAVAMSCEVQVMQYIFWMWLQSSFPTFSNYINKLKFLDWTVIPSLKFCQGECYGQGM